ncbi:VOC family protein [Acidisphaera sp. L21]|uniref:VOC family protein n=1 Tax=Acidisphaera sp. L21 TaxID=1641851 RepID=UPI00131EA1A2|nr:VOC family protein [Acidisphaera sp. L21]
MTGTLGNTAFELDHVGVGARDLAPLAAAYERLGFTLTPPARHRGKATGNRCIMLQHGYVELIALIDPSIPDRLHAQLDRYTGLHIIALGIQDSQATLDRLNKAGLAIPAITPLERPVDDADPTGLQARFERIPLPDAPEGTIQLIKHLTREAIWQPRFTAHANAATALEEVVLAVPDPAEAAARFSRLAGLPVSPDPAGGFVLAMDRGRMRILPTEAIGAVYPGVAAPALPSMVGMTVRTADGCAALRNLLGDVPHDKVGDGVLVRPVAAGGAAVLFT